MVDQYDAIEAVPGVHLNGNSRSAKISPTLAGFGWHGSPWQDKAQAAHLDMNAKTDGYTPEQRFWIAYAQQWCTQTRPEQLRSQAQADPHAPDEYRTNSVLQDLPEFAKSFSCKPTDKDGERETMPRLVRAGSQAEGLAPARSKLSLI